MLKISPIRLADANEYITKYHRHHKRTAGHKFSIAVSDKDGAIHGVVIVGRPVARGNDDGLTLEVTRLCTDGTPNACSMLYNAAFRAAREMGYRKVITYILDSEPGTSLKAAGWVFDGVTRGGSWSCKSRPREDKAPTCPKQRWYKEVKSNDT